MLEESMEGLRKSAEQLRFSLKKCAVLAPPLSADNLESIEALTSRFARTSDVLTHKAVRSLLYFLREDTMTFLDTTNFLEKISVAPSADDVIEVRDLRNEIAHEYSNRDTLELRDACTLLSSTLFELIQRLETYVRDLPHG